MHAIKLVVTPRTKVVVIPIPVKPDYSQAEARHPVASLECLGKLLEKGVTKRLLFEITTQNLICTTRFGGRNTSSCLDATLTLLSGVDAAYANNIKCCISLFDLKGFFDNVNQGRVNHPINNVDRDEITSLPWNT